MKKEETVRYLANIYCVVTSDGTVDRAEERVLEEISRDIRAGYFERKQALEMANNERLPAQLTVRWSDQIRNLEDMLFAAYCNGVLEPAEKEVIVDYANLLDINQKQLNGIKEEAKRRYEEFS